MDQQLEIDQAIEEIKNGRTVPFETFIAKNK